MAAIRSKRPRDVMGLGLAALNKFASAAVIDRLNLRKPAERVVYEASRTGFRAVGAANRTFTAMRGRGKPERPAAAAERGLFDLTPSDEQKMIVEATAEFAAEQLRPAAAAADDACVPPEEILKRSVAELGMTQLAVPEALGGMGGERSATTGVLVNEALAHGDMGLAVACLAPAAVSTALTLWGDENQQAAYLPSFVGEDVPAAALTVQLGINPELMVKWLAAQDYVALTVAVRTLGIEPELFEALVACLPWRDLPTEEDRVNVRRRFEALAPEEASEIFELWRAHAFRRRSGAEEAPAVGAA